MIAPTLPLSLLLTRTVTVQRATLVAAGAGGSSEQLVTVATVKGALQPTSSRERLTAEQSELYNDHVLYVPSGTDIARGDRVSVAGDADRFRVVDVNDEAGLGHHLKCGLRVELD